MALAEVEAKTFTPTVGGPPEYIPEQTDGKTYVLLVDVHNMQESDELGVVISTKVTATSNSRTVFQSGDAAGKIEGLRGGLGTGSIWVSPPIPAVHSYSAFLIQTTGTAREFSYSLVSLD